MLEVLDLKSLARHDSHSLDVHVGTRQQQALLSDRRRRRDSSAKKFTANLLIGRHRLDGRVVLVGPHEAVAIGAGSAQHGIEIFEDAQRFFLTLGQPRVWRPLRKHIGRYTVLEVLRHQPGGKNPAASLYALRELDLSRPELDREQR